MQTILDLLFCWIKPVIYLIPKRKEIWVFGSWFGIRYSDNTKILFESCLQSKQIKPIWISKDKALTLKMREKNLPAYYAFSIKGIYYCIVAYYAFYTCGPRDINEYLISGTKRVQLWHGIPIKKILYDDNITYTHSLKGRLKIILIKILRQILPSKNQNWHLIISSSSNVSERLMSAFQVGLNKIFNSGYPRHQYLLENITKKPANIVLYAPTHRKEGTSNFNELTFIDGLDLELLDLIAEKENFIFMIRLHHYHSGIDIIKKLEGFKHIKISEKSEDIYDLLPSVKCLITDYSSIYLDFLVFNRPVIHFCFDHREYLKSDRGLYEDFEVNSAGPIFEKWADVLAYISKNEDTFSSKRMALKTKFLGNTDRNSNNLIFERLINEN
jgi:CDP-glycerol glycerophosphotransferase (TagB/SpsB family)